MSDPLALPQVPEPRPEDPEDVSWALSTAEAMWARGDHAEGIKWVRRAAEAASESERDGRALELAKAAANLAALISRMSRVAIDFEDLVPIEVDVPPPVPPPVRAPVGKPAAKPAGGRPDPGTPAVAKQVATPSRPPAPLPSRTSQPPPSRSSKPFGAVVARPSSIRPAVPKPEARDSKDKRDAKKPSRRSREGLEAEVRKELSADTRSLEINDTAANPAFDPKGMMLSADTVEVANVGAPRKRERDAFLDSGAIAAWDADSTLNVNGRDVGPASRKSVPAPARPSVDLKTTLQSASRPIPASRAPSIPATPPAVTTASLVPAAAAAAVPTSASRPPSERHDPGIVTSQAVRVVVWRDASGVHVAPTGTVVSAITVDAVLVALEPNADLTAWLTQRKGR